MGVLSPPRRPKYIYTHPHIYIYFVKCSAHRKATSSWCHGGERLWQEGTPLLPPPPRLGFKCEKLGTILEKKKKHKNIYRPLLDILIKGYFGIY